MTLPDQIETIFTKHDRQYGSKEAWREALIADLVALWLNPKMELLEQQLEDLLRKYLDIEVTASTTLSSTGIPSVEYLIQRRWSTAKEWEQFRRHLGDLFLTWAIQPTHPKGWCPDWTWNAQDQLWYPTNPKDENHWHPDYRFCEWCGARRPDIPHPLP